MASLPRTSCAAAVADKTGADQARHIHGVEARVHDDEQTALDVGRTSHEALSRKDVARTSNLDNCDRIDRSRGKLGAHLHIQPSEEAAGQITTDFERSIRLGSGAA